MTHRVILTNNFSRKRARDLVSVAPNGYVMTIAEPKRTGTQSDKMWAMLSDISIAKPEGRRLIPDDWKILMMHACGWECQFLEGLDGRPFPKGFSSSKLTKGQMSDLLSFIQAYGDQHNVRWTDDKEQE